MEYTVNLLIVLAGLPGVGKTSVADQVATRVNGVHLSIDVIEESILGCGLPPSWQVGVAAYEVARATAEANLKIGHDVVVDAVNDSDIARQTWRNAASSTGADLHFVHLVISDPEEHRRRLLGRDRGFDHVAEPAWHEVKQRREDYAPWTDKCLEFDAGTSSAAAIARAVVDRLDPA